MKRAPSSITEREVAAELAAELNDYIQQGGTPFEKATVEHRTGNRYPDITIWIRYDQQAFAFWELKAPGLQEDLSKLPEKAQQLGVRYVVVWNFQSGNLYEIEAGQLTSRKSYPIPLLNALKEWSIATKRIAVVEQAKRIVDDLARLARHESLTPFTPDKFYFIGILEKAIHHLVPVLQAHLFQKKKDSQIRAQIDRWTVEQGYPINLPDLEQLLARHWAYSLAVRLLFYLTIRRYYSALPDLQLALETSQPVAPLLQDAFSKAQSVDWQAVFEPSPLDRLGLPSSAEPILRELLDDFHRYDFSALKEDVIGQIMEGLIPEEERHALGQYFTREDLVDLIIGFVVKHEEGYYIDPTCGSGTFLNRLYSRLRWLSGYRLHHDDLLERLWGVDIAHFPAELATINLFRQNVRDFHNFPRILVRDFFQVRPGETLSFPPLKANAPHYSKIEIPIPLFDGIVGNFPYIRQELIERQSKGYKQKMVFAIARQWFWKAPELFERKGIRPSEIAQVRQQPPSAQEHWLEKQVQENRISLRLSGQADIYAYLFYHASAFLKEGARLGIVTSNAWLDVAYGTELKRFFLRHFKIIAIVASWCEPWFEDASINTAFVILERCEDPEARKNHIVRFVKLRKPLSEILPRDLILQESERWKKVDALVREIETADAQFTSWDPATGRISPLEGVHTLETEVFRIRLITQGELEAELEQKGETAKWGLYIRAPKVYFDILRNAGDKLVPLSQVADVRFGIKTGINEFFYLKPLGAGTTPGTLRVRNDRGWVGEIEQDLLKPAILSLKEVKTLNLTSKEAQWLLFLCPYDKASLMKLGYHKALEYIRWGEQQRTTGRGRVGVAGVPFPEVPSVKGRQPDWFSLPVRTPDSLISNNFVGERFGFLLNQEVMTSNTFFGISFHTEQDLYAALLNSTLTFLFVELTGRQTWGEGVLYIYGPELKDLPVPQVAQIPIPLRKRILKAFDPLRQRQIMPIAQEVKQKDRQALDRAVLEALGLDPDRYLREIYQGLVEMVEERLSLPKQRLARQKREKRMSLEQVKERLRQEVLQGGLKPITAFLPSQKLDTLSVPLTGRPVSWSAFLNEFTLLDGMNREVGKFQGTDQQMRYLLYASLPGQYRVEVPIDPLWVTKITEQYEQYLRQIGQNLCERALEATRNHRQAERVAREILESLGLVPLAVSVAMGE